MSTTTHMYRENRKSLNWFVGCSHDCVYCKPSFQRQMKRQLHNCKRCYTYEPHAHLERLLKPPPKTESNEFIFFPSSGDPAFASPNELNTALDYVEKYPDTTFLMQSKDPIQFHLTRKFPNNLILGTTIETNKVAFYHNPSRFRAYYEISDAPHCWQRAEAMIQLSHKRKEVTLEPVLSFDKHAMLMWIENIDPEFVYVGYDNHNCQLPEPTLKKTQNLIADLELITEVRVKTLRKAWYER